MKNLRILIYCLSLVLLGSCKKDDETMAPSSDGTPYYIEMTDAPAPYQAVNVDLRAVEVIGNGGAVMKLKANAGIYNLLELCNGLDTLIAQGSLNVSSVEQIRLILGTNNSVVTSDGVSHFLSTPSAQQSGLKLQVHHKLQTGVAFHALLDFDANQSVVDNGDGSFTLKPVIRTIDISSTGSLTTTGSIKGKVSKVGVLTAITATSGSFSCTTNVNARGEFTLKGLTPGVYSLTIKPLAPFSSSTVGSIVVTQGSTTDVGVITIE